MARRVEPLTSEHPEAVPATAPASPTAVLIGSVAFGLLFLLAWQFCAAGARGSVYIIPTVSDPREFGRMAAREHHRSSSRP